MDELAGFLTSKLAAGVFACGLICTGFLLFQVVDRQIKTRRLKADAEGVSKAVEWLALSPWEGSVKVDLSDRLPLDLWIRGEICSGGEVLTISAGRRGFRHDLSIILPLPINGGNFELGASNPQCVIVKKSALEGVSVALCAG